MKIATTIFAAVTVLALSFGSNPNLALAAAHSGGGDGMPHSVKGKITKVEREGRVLHINGKKYSVSGSRSNICIKGACDEDRAKLKAGMSCEGNTSARKKGMEIKKISCK